jgi:lipopolysaccharide export system permease protein
MKSFFSDRLPILDLYLFRRILVPSFAVTLILLSALAMERVLRLVQRVTNEGLSASAALGLVVYLLPHYLGLAVPAGFFFGTLSGMRNLHERSELVVMRTFGVSMRRLLLPILVLAAILTVMMGLLTAYTQPYARHAFRQRLNDLTASHAFTQLRAGVFERIGPDLTLRAKEVSDDGRHFNLFFLAWNRAEGRRIFVTARSAQLLDGDAGGAGADIQLMLRNGSALEERIDARGKPSLSQMEFSEMRFSIPMSDVVEAPGPRGRDERELTVPELWAGGIPGHNTEASAATLRAELHARMLNTFVVPVFGVLAIPMALIGRGRGARARGYVLAMVVFVLFEKLAGLGQTLAAGGAVSPWLSIWALFAGLVGITGAFFHHCSGDSGRSLFEAMAAAWPQSPARRGGAGGGGWPA